MTQNNAFSSGKTLGELLCTDAKLSVEKVFAQQFRLTCQDEAPLRGFTQNHIGNWRIETGTDLPIALATFCSGAGQAAVLGLAVDSYGKVITQRTLATNISTMPSLDAVEAYLSSCAGRYAFVISLHDNQRLYLDPVGSLGALYDPHSLTVASTLNILLRRRVINNKQYPQSAARFAFGHTKDQFVRRLLPNHYLDLNKLIGKRHWPKQNDILESSIESEKVIVSKITSRLQQVISALAEHSDSSYLAVSGGVDSRVLLACSKPVLENITLFSHATNPMSRKDTRIARILASKVNQELLVIDPKLNDPDREIDDEWLAKAKQSLHIATAGHSTTTIEHEVLSTLPSGGIVLRGNVADFLKAVLWRRGVYEYIDNKQHETSLGLHMMMLGDHDVTSSDFMKEQYEGWYSDFVGGAQKRPYDLLFSEQFLSHGLGNVFYGFENNFYICPFNDRSLLPATIGLSPSQRANFKYTDAIIESLAPELLEVRYTRDDTNRRRLRRLRLEKRFS